jgi:hypothetical protein
VGSVELEIRENERIKRTSNSIKKLKKYYTNSTLPTYADTLKMVKYRVRYVHDTDTRLISHDTRIGKVSLKSLFLIKK